MSCRGDMLPAELVRAAKLKTLAVAGNTFEDRKLAKLASKPSPPQGVPQVKSLGSKVGGGRYPIPVQ